MRTWTILAITTLMLASCSDDSASSNDGSVADQTLVDQGASPDQGATPDQGASLDQGTTPDQGADLAAPADGAVADGPAADAPAATWPPPTPYHSGKQCTLPPCDPQAAETTDLSGKWTQKITTNSQTCNPLVQSMKAELQKGHVETLTGQTFLRSGECIYDGKIGGTVVGVIKGNVLITCQVLPVDTGVTPVVESQITFSGATGTGPAWTYLFDVPLPPASCQANCTVDFQKE